MKCSQVQEKLSAYLDREISNEEKGRIDDHIKTCKICREELASLTELNSTLDTLESIEIPPYFRTRVKQRIKDHASQIPVIERIRRIFFPLVTTAVLVISLLVGNYIGRSLYQDIAESSIQESSEIAGTFGLGSLSEFPEGSLSDVFYDYVPGGDQ